MQLRLKSNTEGTRGRGFWKFNTSLLRDITYVEQINRVLDDKIHNLNNMDDKGLMWDTIKMLITSHTINYASYKAKQRREYEVTIQKEIVGLMDKMHDNPDDDTKLQYYTNIKELELINNERTKGHQIRAHAMHIECNERNSKYFPNKEKTSSTSKKYNNNRT